MNIPATPKDEAVPTLQTMTWGSLKGCTTPTTEDVPKHNDLLGPTLVALQELWGSGLVSEIAEQIDEFAATSETPPVTDEEFTRVEALWEDDFGVTPYTGADAAVTPGTV